MKTFPFDLNLKSKIHEYIVDIVFSFFPLKILLYYKNNV